MKHRACVILNLFAQQYQCATRHKSLIRHWCYCDLDQLRIYIRVRVVYGILVRDQNFFAWLCALRLFSRSGSVSTPTTSATTTGSTTSPSTGSGTTSTSSSSGSASSPSASNFNGNGNGALGTHVGSGKVGSIAMAVVGVVAGAVFV